MCVKFNGQIIRFYATRNQNNVMEKRSLYKSSVPTIYSTSSIYSISFQTSVTSYPANKFREGNHSTQMKRNSFSFFFRSFSSHPSPPTVTSTSHSLPTPKMTIEKIYQLYTKDIPLTMMTAHDYPSGIFCEKSHMDMVLVGDSLAM